MGMQDNLQKGSALLYLIAWAMLVACVAAAQEDTTFKAITPKQRLQTPASVKGFAGGESHDSDVIRARRGQTMSVGISWRREGANRAEFTDSESPKAFTGEAVKFGRDVTNGRLWIGRIPKNGDYYIYVVAHPTAHYTLKVSVRQSSARRFRRSTTQLTIVCSRLAYSGLLHADHWIRTYTFQGENLNATQASDRTATAVALFQHRGFFPGQIGAIKTLGWKAYPRN
jgi:hypothetical protein